MTLAEGSAAAWEAMARMAAAETGFSNMLLRYGFVTISFVIGSAYRFQGWRRRGKDGRWQYG
jgi:hypothetical protein